MVLLGEALQASCLNKLDTAMIRAKISLGRKAIHAIVILYKCCQIPHLFKLVSPHTCPPIYFFFLIFQFFIENFSSHVPDKPTNLLNTTNTTTVDLLLKSSLFIHAVDNQMATLRCFRFTSSKTRVQYPAISSFFLLWKMVSLCIRTRKKERQTQRKDRKNLVPR